MPRSVEDRGHAPGRELRVSLLAGWVLTPLVLAALCCGLGLLAERLTRTTLPGGLVPGVGLAVLIVVCGLPVAVGRLAPAGIVLVAALATAGLVSAAPWRDGRLRAAGPAGVAAVTALALHAAPSLLTGQGTSTGWTQLDDDATWFALADHVLAHGRAVGPGASSHVATLAGWLPTGYPVGALLPFGAAARLTGQDLATAYAPALCTYAAILALGLRVVAREAGAGRWAATAVGIAAAQASLLYGYAHLGGIKELATAALLPTGAWCARRAGRPWVAALALVVAGALGGVLGLAGLVWIGPLVGLTAWALARAPGAQQRPRTAFGLAVLLAAAALPALLSLRFGRTISIEGRRTTELGVLDRPLPLLQGVGLWPDGDLPAAGPAPAGAHLLAVVAVLLGVAVVVHLSRRRATDLPALLAVVLVGVIAAVLVGNAWIDAKALAIAAPFAVLAVATATALVLAVPSVRTRAVGAALAAVLLVALGASTLDVLRDTTAVPRVSLADLRAIGVAARGAGPTLQLDPDVTGDRWALRDADADGVTDLRMRSVTDDAGAGFPEGEPVDVERVALRSLARYRTLVRLRSPVASTPPSAFVPLLVRSRWEAWTRDPAAPRPLGRLALGTALDPVAPVPCATLDRLVRATPGVRRLVAQPREAPVVAGLDAGALPAGWRADGALAVPARDRTALVPVALPRAGRWRVWVGGSVYGTLTAYLDGRAVGHRHHEVRGSPAWLRFGARTLAAGRHTVALRFRRGVLAGRHARGDQAPLGPVALTREGVAPLPVDVRAGDRRRLCDERTYDWVELQP